MRPIIKEAVQAIILAAKQSLDPASILQRSAKHYRESAKFWGNKYLNREDAAQDCNEVADALEAEILDLQW